MFEFLFGQKADQRISPAQAKERLASGGAVFLLDVRTKEEYAALHIPNSISLPLDGIKHKIARLAPDKDAELIVYCQSGGRAAQACGILSDMGYTHVRNLGGIDRWPYETERGGGR